MRKMVDRFPAALIIGLLGVLLIAIQGATNAPAPGYKPGATVTMEYYFTVPSGFHLGDEPCVGVVFDKEAFKKLPVTVSKYEFTWNRDKLGVKATDAGGEKTTVAAKVKLKLKSSCPVGELKIPVCVTVFYCNTKEGWCTSSEYSDPIKLNVTKKMGALSKGTKKITFSADPNA